jgi:exodeoxyribonuclease V gamma subunit
VIGYDVVRRVLEERLAEVPERQPFLAGGITFCGMVPQRAIPFAMIAVLGLDEGALPRATTDGGLDPITAKPRFGDRDTRDDDRYLFLETLMAARQRLHLSWIGRDERDGSLRSPSALLAELLTVLDAMHGISEADAERPWLVQQPLQPFDARYFDGKDPRLYSFSAEFAAMRADDAHDAPVPALRPTASIDVAAERMDAAPGPLDAVLPLARWLRWFKDPMRELIEQRLAISMAALDASEGSSDEPLAPALQAIERWPQRLLFECVLPKGSLEALDTDAKPWLEAAGVLPAGRAGDAAFAALRTVVEAAFVAWQSLSRRPNTPPLASESLRMALGAAIIEGRIDGVTQVKDGIALVRLYAKDDKIRPEESLHFGQRVPLFIEWALLRLARSDGKVANERVHIVALGTKLDARRPWLATIDAWDTRFVSAGKPTRRAMVEDLRRRLAVLHEVYANAVEAPWAYFPRAAFAISEDRDGHSALFGSAQHDGELDYGAKPARVLGIDVGLGDPDLPRYRDLERTAKRVAETIALKLAENAR